MEVERRFVVIDNLQLLLHVQICFFFGTVEVLFLFFRVPAVPSKQQATVLLLVMAFTRGTYFYLVSTSAQQLCSENPPVKGGLRQLVTMQGPYIRPPLESPRPLLGPIRRVS